MGSQSLGIYFGHRKLGIQSQKNEEKEIKYNLIYDLDGTCLSNVYIFLDQALSVQYFLLLLTWVFRSAYMYLD